MNLLEQRLQEAINHLRRQAAWQALSSALIIGSVCSLLLLLFLQTFQIESRLATHLAVLLALLPLIVLPAVLCGQALRLKISRHAAADLIDECYQLPDSARTAVDDFPGVVAEHPRTAEWRSMQQRDTIERLSQSQRSVADLVPLKGPRFWPLSVALTIISLLFAWHTDRSQLLTIADNNSTPSQQLREAIDLLNAASRSAEQLGVTPYGRAIDSGSAIDSGTPTSTKLPASQRELRQFASLQTVMNNLIDSLSGSTQTEATELRQLGTAFRLSPETAEAGNALEEERWLDASRLISALELHKLSEPARRGIAAEISRQQAPSTLTELAAGLLSNDDEQLDAAQTKLAALIDVANQKAELALRLNSDATKLANLRAQREFQELGNPNAATSAVNSGQGASRVAGNLRLRSTAESGIPASEAQGTSAVFVLPEGPQLTDSKAPEKRSLQTRDVDLLNQLNRSENDYTRQVEDVLRATRIPRQQRSIVQRYFESLHQLQAEANKAEP